MKLERENLGDVTILKLNGVLSGGRDGEEMKTMVRQLMDEGCRKLVVDMGGRGLGQLLGIGSPAHLLHHGQEPRRILETHQRDPASARGPEDHPL